MPRPGAGFRNRASPGPPGGEGAVDLPAQEVPSAAQADGEADQRGEVAFYEALLKIRQQAPADQALPLLERAAKAGQPYAIALLYRVYNQPMLGQEADALKAEEYRKAYAELDVAKSGYPNFERAGQIVDQLLSQQPAQ